MLGHEFAHSTQCVHFVPAPDILRGSSERVADWVNSPTSLHSSTGRSSVRARSSSASFRQRRSRPSRSARSSTQRRSRRAMPSRFVRLLSPPLSSAPLAPSRSHSGRAENGRPERPAARYDRPQLQVRDLRRGHGRVPRSLWPHRAVARRLPRRCVGAIPLTTECSSVLTRKHVQDS